MSELNEEQLDYLEYCKAKFQIDESPLSFYDWQWLCKADAEEIRAVQAYHQALDNEAMQEAYEEAESFYLTEYDSWLDGWDEED